MCVLMMAMMLCSTSVGMAEETAQEEKMMQTEEPVSEEDSSQDKETADQTNASDQADTELAEGQRKVTVKVVSITGNELTYYEVPEETEESETAADTETAESEEKDLPSEQSANSEKNENTETDQTENITPAPSETGEQPGNMDPSQMGNGEQPGNFDPSQMRGGRSGNSDSGQSGDGKSFQGRGDKSGRMKQETKTVYLPVSVIVHTDMDKEMTFSILKAGDELEVLFEENEDGEEIITEIWLKSTEGGAV